MFSRGAHHFWQGCNSGWWLIVTMSALALAVVCGVTAAAVEDVHFFRLSMTICCGSGRTIQNIFVLIPLYP